MILRALIISLLSIGTIAAPVGASAADEPIQPIPKPQSQKMKTWWSWAKCCFLTPGCRNPGSFPVIRAIT